MTISDAQMPPEGFDKKQIALRGLTFPSVRLALARFLVTFSFVWPFFNYQLIDPSSSTEINFLPVFLAALLLPEVTLRQRWPILLALPVFAVALIWGSPTAPIRLAIGIIPLSFAINLSFHLRERNQDLIPPGLAYRALQIFVGFCVVQTVQFRLFHIIPEWLTGALMAIVPRYSGVPYDDFGIRGVQGWASEPSSAGLTCIAFAIVAICQRPDRRWRVLALLSLLLVLNGSVYALVVSILFGLSCLFTLQRKRYSLLLLVLLSIVTAVYIGRSGRVADLSSGIATSGINSWSNEDFKRFGQIFGPLQQLPYIYKPVMVSFNGRVSALEPLGLLPLLAGYGSVLGFAWLVYILWHNFPLKHVGDRPLMLIAAFVLLIMASPDLIPSVVALAVFAVPRIARSAVPEIREQRRAIFCRIESAVAVQTKGWLDRL